MTNSDDLANQLIEEMDPVLKDFIRTRVNSFIKWDLVRFFHDNPHTTDTAENIARYTGRDPRVVEPELEQLAKARVLEVTHLNEMTVYSYGSDRQAQQLIHDFLLACNDRQFRVKALYQVIMGMVG